MKNRRKSTHSVSLNEIRAKLIAIEIDIEMLSIDIKNLTSQKQNTEAKVNSLKKNVILHKTENVITSLGEYGLIVKELKISLSNFNKIDTVLKNKMAEHKKAVKLADQLENMYEELYERHLNESIILLFPWV